MDNESKVRKLELRVLELEAKNRRLVDALAQRACRCPFCGSQVTCGE